MLSHLGRFTSVALIGLCAAALVGCPPLTGKNTFTFHNEGAYVVDQLFLSGPFEEPGYGPNRITDPLQPGASVLVTELADGNYRVYIRYIDTTKPPGQQQVFEELTPPTQPVPLWFEDQFEWWWYGGA